MNSHTSPASRSVHPSASTETLKESLSSQAEAANSQPGGLSETVNQLSRDLGTLKDTFARLASQAGDAGVKTVRGMGQTVTSQVGSAASGVAGTGSDLAAQARDHAKTFAAELENMARRNPLGTIAGALVVGLVIGMMSRGRN